MEELVKALGNININSDSAVLIAKEYIRLQYLEMYLKYSVVAILLVIACFLAFAVFKDK